METLEGSYTFNLSAHLKNSTESHESLQPLVECLNVVSTGVLSASYSVFAFLVGGVLTSLLSLIGTFGNLKSVILLRNSQVFTRGQFLTETLTALAVWDTILLLSVAGYYSVAIIFQFFGNAPTPFLYSMVISHPLSAASFTASAMLVAALTIQRMFVVRHPLRPHRLSVRKSS